jgi:hypothetical protein
VRIRLGSPNRKRKKIHVCADDREPDYGKSTQQENAQVNKEKRDKWKESTYILSSAVCDTGDENGHVANDVSSESQIKKHEENVKDHFPFIDRMQISIPNSSEGGDGPVDAGDVEYPKAFLSKVRKYCPQPCLALSRLWVSDSQQIIKAGCAMTYK